MIPPPFNHATGSASKAGGKNKATGSTNNGVEFCKGSLLCCGRSIKRATVIHRHTESTCKGGALFMMSDDGPDMDAKDGAFKMTDVKSIFARQLCKNTNTIIGSVLA